MVVEKAPYPVVGPAMEREGCSGNTEGGRCIASDLMCQSIDSFESKLGQKETEKEKEKE